MLIGLGHKMQRGKDTVADILVEKHGYTKLSFAAALKTMALEIDPVIFQPPAVNLGGGHGRLRHLVTSEGWETAKRYPEVRRFLEKLGESARDTFGENVWVDKLIGGGYGPTNVVISDVRYRNEADMIHFHAGKVVRIDRPGQPMRDTPAETSLDGYTEWDYVLDNSGPLSTLPAKVEDMLIDLQTPRPNKPLGDERE